MRAEYLPRDAGFTRFRVHDFEEPANLYYEVRTLTARSTLSWWSWLAH